MKKKTILINSIIPVALSLLIIILSLKFINKSRELGATLAVLEKQTGTMNAFINKNNVYTYYENLLLNNKIDSTLIIEDLVGNTLHFKDLNLKKPTLILFIHQTHCSSCWGKAMEILVQNYPEIAEKDLIVLTSYQNFRDIAIQLQELHLSSNVYNIVSGSFGNVLEDLGVPFIIIDTPTKLTTLCRFKLTTLRRSS